MDRQKGLAPILIVILIALAVGGYLVYSKQTTQSTPAPKAASPVPTDTGETANPDSIGANWKTYTNTLYGYLIKLPPELFADEIVNRVDINTNPSGYPSASIAVVSGPDDFEFKFLTQFLSMKINDQKKIEGEFEGFNTFDRLPDEKIADNTAMVFENSKIYEFVGKNRKWIIQKGDKTYILSLLYQTDDELNKYNKIFSTIKFQ